MEVLPDHFKRFPLEEYFTGVHVQRVMNCNWKVGAEAFMESWHTVRRTSKSSPSPAMPTHSMTAGETTSVGQ